ncbi:MAG: toll/interleukin-1 receptor domain-containing protein [Anaerolineae bacterium]|nr:toll/interleukin-1 receptor domain-containing protein [Anaerolineae bacterium]
MDTYTWDGFISYKSGNVELARLIADHLIASGVRVWFAEYQVLLDNYGDFQREIDKGLQNSEFGICFTNNSYMKSEYCRLELDHFLDRNKPKKILEINTPLNDGPYTRPLTLESSPFHIADHPEGILSFIRENTRWSVDTSVTKAPKHKWLSFLGRCIDKPFTLDTIDWELTNKGKIDRDGNVGGVELSYKHQRDKFRLFVNLYCGEDASPNARRLSSDDRNMYESLIEFAKVNHMRLFNAQMHGLHLFFHQSLSQIALTYTLGNFLTRKCSVIIPNSKTGKMAEFVFTFKFVGSFRDYCRYSHVMDYFVKSLTW